MTFEELNKIPFQMTAYIAGSDNHQCIYSTEDGRFGFAVITLVKADFDGYKVYGRRRIYFRIGDEIYKSKKKFIEALAKE